MTIGVSPPTSVPCLATVGTKLPASFSALKKSRPFWASSSVPPLASAAAWTDWMAWLELSGSPASATELAYSGLSRSAQSFGLSPVMTALLTSNERTP